MSSFFNFFQSNTSKVLCYVSGGGFNIKPPYHFNLYALPPNHFITPVIFFMKHVICTALVEYYEVGFIITVNYLYLMSAHTCCKLNLKLPFAVLKYHRLRVRSNALFFPSNLRYMIECTIYYLYCYNGQPSGKLYALFKTILI